MFSIKAGAFEVQFGASSVRFGSVRVGSGRFGSATSYFLYGPFFVPSWNSGRAPLAAAVSLSMVPNVRNSGFR